MGDDFSVIKRPSLAGLFPTYVGNKGLSVAIVDAPAFNLSPEDAAKQVVDQYDPVLISMAVYGFQPSASTQNMASAGETCRALKELDPIIKSA